MTSKVIEGVVVEKEVAEELKCSYCDKTFKQKQTLYRHIRKQHDTALDLRKGEFVCQKCDEKFTRKSNLYRHMRVRHGDESDRKKSWFLCKTCERPFISKLQRDKHAKCHGKEKIHQYKHCETAFFSFSNFKLHEKTCLANSLRQPTLQTGGGSTIDQRDDGILELHQTVFNNAIQVFRLVFNSSNTEKLLDRLQSALKQVFQRLTLEKENNKPCKIYVSLQANFYRSSNPDEITEPPPSFNTEPVVIFTTTDVQEVIEILYLNLLNQIDGYERAGSGWILLNLVYLDLHVVVFDPLYAYRRYRDDDEEEWEDSD